MGIIKNPRGRPRINPIEIQNETPTLKKQGRPRGRPRIHPIKSQPTNPIKPKRRYNKKIVSQMKKFIQVMNSVKRPVGRPRKNSIGLNLMTVEKKTIPKNKLKSFDNNENKDFANNHFVKETMRKLSLLKKKEQQTARTLILDSYENNTANTLVGAKFLKDNIVIPEKNKDTHNTHKANGFEGAYRGTLKKFATTMKQSDPYVSMYFDTCGIIRTQKKGIFDIITNATFCNESFLGFTFSRRGVEKQVILEEKENFIFELKQLLNKKNFQFYELSLDYTYAGSELMTVEKGHHVHMNTFFYKISRK